MMQAGENWYSVPNKWCGEQPHAGMSEHLCGYNPPYESMEWSLQFLQWKWQQQLQIFQQKPPDPPPRCQDLVNLAPPVMSPLPIQPATIFPPPSSTFNHHQPATLIPQSSWPPSFPNQNVMANPTMGLQVPPSQQFHTAAFPPSQLPPSSSFPPQHVSRPPLQTLVGQASMVCNSYGPSLDPIDSTLHDHGLKPNNTQSPLAIPMVSSTICSVAVQDSSSHPPEPPILSPQSKSVGSLLTPSVATQSTPSAVYAKPPAKQIQDPPQLNSQVKPKWTLFERPSSESNYDNKACSPGKQCNDLMYDRRLANDNSSDLPILDAELEGFWEQLHLKDSQDNDSLHGISDLDDARKCAKESSLGAIGKLPLWTRSGSFASQSSGFSHSSSLKSLGADDSSDRKTDFLPQIGTVTQSFSGDATACATAVHLSEEMSARKKQRLGWGEGLAKYEKKKVDVNTNEDGTILLENNTEELQSLNKCVPEKSPTAAIASDFGSPTTPSSVACSSSPGFAGKSSLKAAIAASAVSNMCRTPSPVSSFHLELFPINIEELDNISMKRFGCLLNELLGSEVDQFEIQMNSVEGMLHKFDLKDSPFDPE